MSHLAACEQRVTLGQQGLIRLVLSVAGIFTQPALPSETFASA